MDKKRNESNSNKDQMHSQFDRKEANRSKRDSKGKENRSFKTKFAFSEVAKMVLKPSFVGRYGDVEDTLGNVSAATCSHVRVQLTIPQDHDKWVDQIQKLYVALTAKYTGRVGFTAAQLEKYILNVRFIRATLLEVRKLYLTLTSNDMNNTYFKDTRRKLLSVYPNPIELLDIYNQGKMDLFSMFPLKLDLLQEDTYLFDKLFKDGRANGATYYDLAPQAFQCVKTGSSYTLANADYIRGGNAGYSTTTNATQIAGWISGQILAMSVDENAQIAAAIRSTYLDDRNTPLPDLSVGDKIDIVYDKLIGLSISNGVIGAIDLASDLQINATDGMVEWSTWTSNSPKTVTYTGTGAAAAVSRDAAVDAPFHDCVLNGIRELDAYDLLRSSKFTKTIDCTLSGSTTSTYYKGVGLYNLSQISIDFNELTTGDRINPITQFIGKCYATVTAFSTNSTTFRSDSDQLATQTDCEWFPRFVAIAEIYSDASFQQLSLFSLIDVIWDVEDYSILSGDFIDKYRDYETEMLTYVPELAGVFNIIELSK